MLSRLLFIFFIFTEITAFSQAPTATISSGVPNDTICEGGVVNYIAATTNTPTSFSWSVSPSQGVVFSSANQTTCAIAFGNMGVYTVSLTVSNLSGTVTVTKKMVVLPAPRASFSASLNTSGYPAQLVLTNYSSNATSYLWTYNETTATDNSTDVIHTYTTSGSYTVTLNAINANGCVDTESYDFYISDSSGITLPNVFTPNGDGVNDVFKPIARGINSMKVNIYSRYGNLVASWDHVNGHWDGHSSGGIACESGTYFCVVEATGFDGKSYKLKGFVSLFKN